MVTPFISHLKLWIDRNKPKGLRARAEEAGAREVPLVAGRAGEQVPLEGFGARPAPRGLGEGSDVERTTSPSVEDSTEDEGIYEQAKPYAPGFGTTAEGTQALQAFFFGGDPITQPPLAEQLTPNGEPAYLNNNSTPQNRVPSFTRPAGIPSEDHFFSAAPTTPDALLPPPSLDPHAASGSGMTPPQLQYERQSSFLQPKPKQTQVQTTRLLDMLNDKNPVASPPPPGAGSARDQRREGEAGQGVGLGSPVGQAEGASLLAILKGGGGAAAAGPVLASNGAGQSAPVQLDRNGQVPTTEEQLRAIEQHQLFQSRYNQPPQQFASPHHQPQLIPTLQQFSAPPPQQQQQQHAPYPPPPGSQAYPAPPTHGLLPPHPPFAPTGQPFGAFPGQQQQQVPVQPYPARSLPPQQFGPPAGLLPGQYPPSGLPGQPHGQPYPVQQPQHQPQHFPQHFPGQSPLPQYAQVPQQFHQQQQQQPYPSPIPLPQQLPPPQQQQHQQQAGRPAQTQQQQSLLAAFGAPPLPPHHQQQGQGQGQGQAGQLLGLFNGR